MKRIVLIGSIVLIVIGFIGRIYASQTEYIAPDGRLAENGWILIGSLLIVLGLLILIILGISTHKSS